MKMRSLLLLLGCMLFTPLLHAETFELDEHYFEVFRPHPGEDPGRVEVTAFFWYACPHCYNLEPHLEGWQETKPEHVDLVRVPAMFDRANVIQHAKTFYALELMGVEQDVHEQIFHAIHEEHRGLNTQQEMESFLAEQGVDVDAYRDAMKSFPVNVQANRARELARDYQITGVPTLVVGGKYRARSLEGPDAIELLEFLIDKVAAERAAATAE